VIAKKRTKVEAARAKLKFAHHESEFIREKNQTRGGNAPTENSHLMETSRIGQKP
jgi:hypothetical protein